MGAEVMRRVWLSSEESTINMTTDCLLKPLSSSLSLCSGRSFLPFIENSGTRKRLAVMDRPGDLTMLLVFTEL